MTVAPWFRRLPDENEIIDVITLIERAMTERRIVQVWFRKEVRTPKGSPRWFKDTLNDVFGRRVMLEATPVMRTIEPLEWKTNAQGEPYVVGICHDTPGEEYPEPRTIRLDRVVVSPSGVCLRVTRRPFIVEGTALDPKRVRAR